MFDYKEGLYYCAGIVEVYEEVLQMFCDSYDEKVMEFTYYIQEEDWQNYAIKIHALKSNAYSVGAKQLGDKCFELEMAGKKAHAGEDADAQIAFIKENQDAVNKVFKETVESVKDYLATK